jgi:STE24 endopeptidase
LDLTGAGYLALAIGLLVLDFLLDLVVNRLNLRRLSDEIPPEFRDVYDPERYRMALRYERDNTRFELLSSSLLTPLTIAFILLGGFGLADAWARAAGGGMIATGLLFAGILLLLSQLVHLPFTIYSTFVIEERYGFNKTTPRTFLLDRVKGLALTAVIGGPILAGLLWFFSNAGPRAWLYSWGAVTVVQGVLLYVAPLLILPLFNKFTPLPAGELREALAAYARAQGFAVGGLFTMDGSRRSTKANAYFTGLGRWRRIVLFDTLVAKHSVAELVAILAHEVGHYRLRHIGKHLLASVLSSGLMFYLLSWFIARPGLYDAFQLDRTPIDGAFPVYGGLVVFGFLYAPISALIAILQNALSRRHEYQADRFAAATGGGPAPLIAGLKKLSVDSLAHLTPHPLKVFLEYSHPPVLDRIRRLADPGGGIPPPAGIDPG